MKKLYFIYVRIPENIYNNKIKYLIPNVYDYRWKHGYMYGLYAWTTKKKYVKEFFEVRDKSAYTLIEKEIEDDDDVKQVNSIHPSLKLVLKKFETIEDGNKKKVEILCTKNEYVVSVIDGDEYLYDFGPEIYEDIDYRLFNDKIIKALDTLMYVNKYDSLFGSVDENSFNEYNAGFNLTKYGDYIKLRDVDQISALLYLFKFFFQSDQYLKKESYEI